MLNTEREAPAGKGEQKREADAGEEETVRITKQLSNWRFDCLKIWRAEMNQKLLEEGKVTREELQQKARERREKEGLRSRSRFAIFQLFLFGSVTVVKLAISKKLWKNGVGKGSSRVCSICIGLPDPRAVRAHMRDERVRRENGKMKGSRPRNGRWSGENSWSFKIDTNPRWDSLL